MHMCKCRLGVQKRVLDPLELEFQKVESHHVGALTEPRGSARAASVLNH